MRATFRILRYGRRYKGSLVSTSRSFTSTAPIKQTQVHADLAKVFDDQNYFNAVSHNSPSYKLPFSFSKQETGLFKNESLTSPSGLVQFSKQSLEDAKSLVKEMLSDKSRQGKLDYIKKLDQLSDTLCRVIDVAEFIRIVHPSSKWIDAAQQTHEILFEYMNQLNTNVELYTTLIDVLNDSQIASELTEEEIKVGEYLKQDFERLVFIWISKLETILLPLRRRFHYLALISTMRSTPWTHIGAQLRQMILRVLRIRK
ncbi:unnamed protein product [Candida parapsilosis]